jgi:hypothetical protein
MFIFISIGLMGLTTFGQVKFIRINNTDRVVLKKHLYGSRDEVYSQKLYKKNYKTGKLEYSFFFYTSNDSDTYDVSIDASNSPYLDTNPFKKYQLRPECTRNCTGSYTYGISSRHEGLLPRHRPCISGYVIGRGRNQRTGEVSEFKATVWIGAYRRNLKWGKFDGLKGRYLSDITISNHNLDQYVFSKGPSKACFANLNMDPCKDADFNFEYTEISNSFLMAQKIVVTVKPKKVKWRTGGVGQFGIPEFAEGDFLDNLHILKIKGDYKTPIVLKPGTRLKAVKEASFAIPYLDDNIEIQSRGKEKMNKQFPSSELQVYPNPFTNKITIQTRKEIVVWKLRTLYGTTVASGREKDVLTTELPKGMYLLQIALASGEIVTKKVIKE